ncbi:MAG: transposase [Mesorhizobium sp.]|uniref:IS66-like element accessory protein TnpA n=1 Tax=unclassified Mesorhizobium TaxID=325217 RepID=UPI000FD1EC45|nr:MULTISPECIES: transposase [unclassified Mesorhizobium]TGU86631.1 transposase [Mesorhizobium sp. M00.F.Ca.ET.151.01.1.1]TGV56116.1 transposase [bacterium M00.F.Ca.ET.141.01.1.1]RUW81672.1 transposase [Mesorhizobium sp. M2A.F.Ca.ET.067.02.1.1]RWB85665.1 MAG: transposase [Mesorhizobium sp.]RWD77091.1 MAG: transposase [Mesorhizobium sp.]
MTISELTLKSNDPEPARRFEVFTGSGRRREWLPEEKARIVAESYDAGETVSAVARRYALSPQQLFAWRRAARQPLAEAPAPESLFVPAVVAAPMSEPAARRMPEQRKRKAARDAGVIELEIDGVAMRVGRGADARTVAAVIRALKAPS